MPFTFFSEAIITAEFHLWCMKIQSTQTRKYLPALFLIAIFFLSCTKDKLPPVPETVVNTNGDITSDVTAFKSSLGNLNTTTGVTGGRREINWDAVPDSFALNNMPVNFFNPTGATANIALQRGFEYDVAGNFRVSKDGFAELKTEAIADVQPFSGTKTFANTGAAAWPVGFKVAGQNTEAAVSAFGVVFVGVNLENTSYIEPFSGDKSLGKFFAKPYNNISRHSFVGVRFAGSIITSVKIVHGNGEISSAEKDITNGGTKDLVVLDDIIYSEPVQQ
jgi:hypothetical protein